MGLEDRRAESKALRRLFKRGLIGALSLSVIAGAGVGVASANGDEAEETGMVLVPINPCRLFDTRSDSTVGERSTPILEEEAITITARGQSGNCTIPEASGGLLLNLTAVNATRPTWLSAYPADAERQLTSVLNPTPGPPVPNAVTVLLSDAGEFTLYNRFGSVDTLADVMGYYIPSVGGGAEGCPVLSGVGSPLLEVPECESAYLDVVSNELWVAADGVWEAAGGLAGADGASAYEVAVNGGFVGTEAEWLASLQGADGGAGVDGASAYEVAVNGGFVGTEAEWLASLQGADGADGADAPYWSRVTAMATVGSTGTLSGSSPNVSAVSFEEYPDDPSLNGYRVAIQGNLLNATVAVQPIRDCRADQGDPTAAVSWFVQPGNLLPGGMSEVWVVFLGADLDGDPGTEGSCMFTFTRFGGVE